MYNVIYCTCTFSGLVLEVVEVVMEGAPCRRVGVYMELVNGLTAVNLALYYSLLVPAPVVKPKDFSIFYCQDVDVKKIDKLVKRDRFLISFLTQKSLIFKCEYYNDTNGD